MAPVKLYVYDLSNGLARTMSRQLTGTQIDGIWHTSIVAYGREVYYGQGIDICRPGGSHHGNPLQVYDLGETEIDEATFLEYIDELRGHYTAEKYHLLEFNCNSFTNDVAGFLTGRSIPAHITDLPAAFLATPFGQSLRPMIDNMYRRPSPGAYPTPAATPPNLSHTAGINPQLAQSLLQSVAAQAASAGPSGSTTGSALTSQLHISSNLASLENIIKSHRAAAVLLTAGANQSLEQVFEQTAREHAAKVGSAFVKVDIEVGSAKEIATKYGVSSPPALLLFRTGHEAMLIEELSQIVIRSRVNDFILSAFPRHPHDSAKIPTILAISTDPILYPQVPPAIDTPVNKLVGFINTADKSTPALDEAWATLKSSFTPYLKKRFPPSSTPAQVTGASKVPVSDTDAKKWISMTSTILESLPPANIFPLIDLWRLAILDGKIFTKVGHAVVPAIENHVASLIAGAASPTEVPRPVLLTTLRLCANTFAHSAVGAAAGKTEAQSQTTAILVAGLLHSDASVRTAAASLAFNVAARRHAPLRSPSGKPGATLSYNWAEFDRRERSGEGERDIELICALLEATEREDNEEVVHRLAASLALEIYLAPTLLGEEAELAGMLEVLGAKEKLEGKLAPGGCGPKGVMKADIRKLLTEVASLCS